MPPSRPLARHLHLYWLVGALALLCSCKGSAREQPRENSSTSPREAGSANAAEAKKVEVKDSAMGTALHFIAYSNEQSDEQATRTAIREAIAEMRRLEGLMSEWQSSSDIGQVNSRPGQWVSVHPETYEVLEKGLAAGEMSHGTFDVTFQVMSGVWKFGSAREAQPRLPGKHDIDQRRRWIDYRKVELDGAARKVRIGRQQQLGLGGIAKGFIVDRATGVLRRAGLRSFLVQAGGDLYGAGRKPDGSAWVSGVQDPRAAQGKFFALLELEDRAFSTAGDYARSYVLGGKRYHHIIDPRTGYPATACRSVTIWARDAATADIVDDAVFILGPQRGLEIVESLEDVGAVVVDASNRVWVSRRLEGRVKVLGPPSDGV